MYKINFKNIDDRAKELSLIYDVKEIIVKNILLDGYSLCQNDIMNR